MHNLHSIFRVDIGYSDRCQDPPTSPEMFDNYYAGADGRLRKKVGFENEENNMERVPECDGGWMRCSDAERVFRRTGVARQGNGL